MDARTNQGPRIPGIWRVIVGAVAFALLTGASNNGMSGPSGFRCPTTGRLVSVGQSLHEVRSHCREPDDARSSVEVRTVRQKVRRWTRGVAEEVVVEHSVEVPVDDWTYDFGRNRFTQLLRFEYGRLVFVQEGSKGAADPE